MASSGFILLSSAVGGPTVFSYTASGGVQTGGTADVAMVQVYAVAGGATGSGAADLSVVQVYGPTGGVQSGGAAVTELISVDVFEYVGSGGVQSGGAAVTSFHPAIAPPPPSETGGGVVAPGVHYREGYEPPGTRRRAPYQWAYVAGGGVRSGGAAVTAWAPAFQSPPPVRPLVRAIPRVYAYVGAGGVGAGGAAGAYAWNLATVIREEDEELVWQLL